MDELQNAVDDLAARLGRSVCVEEPGFRPLAVSAGDRSRRDWLAVRGGKRLRRSYWA